MLGIVGMASIVCSSFREVPDIAGAWNLILVSRRTGRRHNNQQLRGRGPYYVERSSVANLLLKIRSWSSWCRSMRRAC